MPLTQELKTRLRNSYLSNTQQPPQEQKSSSFFDRASKFGETLLKKPSEFLFGSTGKTVGGLVTRGIGGIKTLTADTPEELQEGRRLMRAGEPTSKLGEATDIAFTTLELYPGGGLVTRAIKKIPGGGKTVEYVQDIFNYVPNKLKASTVKQFEKVLAPTKNKFKDITTRVAEEGAERLPLASSRKSLLNKVQSEVYRAGDEIDNVIMTIDGGQQLKIQPLLDDLTKYKDKFIVSGKEGKKFITNKQAVQQIDDISQELVNFANTEGGISFESLRRLRQSFDEAVSAGDRAFNRTLSEGTLINAQRELSNAIRNEFSKEFPDLAKVNKEFTFWKRIEDVLSETTKRKTGTGIPFKRIATGVGGAAALGPQGAIGAVAAEKLFTSVAWRTLDIKLKNALANALTVGTKSEVKEIWGQILRRLPAGIRNEIIDAQNEKQSTF